MFEALSCSCQHSLLGQFFCFIVHSSASSHFSPSLTFALSLSITSEHKEARAESFLFLSSSFCRSSKHVCLLFLSPYYPITRRTTEESFAHGCKFSIRRKILPYESPISVCIDVCARACVYNHCQKMKERKGREGEKSLTLREKPQLSRRQTVNSIRTVTYLRSTRLISF